MQAAERRGAGRPTKEDAAAIADRVLDGARAAFCRDGIDGALMDEIAAKIGVTKHTIYRRYPSKIALLDAVVDRELVRLKAWLKVPGERRRSPLDALERAACRFFEYGARPENVSFTLFLIAESAFSAEMQQKYVRWEQLAMAPLIERIERAQRVGLLVPGDPADICDILIGLTDSATRRWRGIPTDGSSGADMQSFFKARWAIFLRAFAAEK